MGWEWEKEGESFHVCFSAAQCWLGTVAEQGSAWSASIIYCRKLLEHCDVCASSVAVHSCFQPNLVQRLMDAASHVTSSIFFDAVCTVVRPKHPSLKFVLRMKMEYAASSGRPSAL